MKKSLNYSEILNFSKGKNVLLTGHTGFKSAWLTKVLLDAGAKIVGYSLTSPTNPRLFSILGFDQDSISFG